MERSPEQELLHLARSIFDAGGGVQIAGARDVERIAIYAAVNQTDPIQELSSPHTPQRVPSNHMKSNNGKMKVVLKIEMPIAFISLGCFS